jgi:hypothetical protein
MIACASRETRFPLRPDVASVAFRVVANLCTPALEKTEWENQTNSRLARPAFEFNKIGEFAPVLMAKKKFAVVQVLARKYNDNRLASLVLEALRQIKKTAVASH